MRVLVVSHSYVATENQKNIAALQRHAEVRVALPHVIEDRVNGKMTPPSSAGAAYAVHRRISLPRNQYLLASRDLGMNEFKPDIVHIEYDPWAPIFWQTCIARARLAPRARIVCTAKKNTLRRLPQPLQAMKMGLANRMLGDVAHVIAINSGVHSIYGRFLGVPSEKMSLMQHLGIDPQTFYPAQDRAPGDPLVVGYCGRLDPHKGVEDLLRAFAAIEAAHPGIARLKLLGQGRMRDDLASRNLPWLDLLPPVPHARVADFLRTLDVFAMPSLILPDHEEHDGHALMEAMACGIASIGSTSGVIPELLNEGCGVLYPAGDVRALTQGLSGLLTSPELRKTTAAQGLARAAEAYTVDGIAAQKTKIYNRVLAA